MKLIYSRLQPVILTCIKHGASKDFAPTSPGAPFPAALAAGSVSGAKSLLELVDWFNANPNKAGDGAHAGRAS